MVIGKIKWKLVNDTYFFTTTMFYLADDGNYLVYFGKEKQIKTLIDDLNELVRKGCAVWMELGEYDFGLVKLSKCPTQTWYSIHQTLYSLEPWGVIKESKKSARKSIKESLNFKKDYEVEVSGGDYWLKPFYWDFDEFRDDLLIASEESGFTYHITMDSTTDYRINIEFNNGPSRRYDITFRIIPKSNKETLKELNDYLN